jgi:hypothetical protein
MARPTAAWACRDALPVEGDPGWSIFGLMRYRSRRDLIRLAGDPRFAELLYRVADMGTEVFILADPAAGSGKTA